MIGVGRFYRPLNILAVISDGAILNPGVMSALSRHYSLICRTLAQARDVIDQFAPDLVLLDDRSHSFVDDEWTVDGSAGLVAVAPAAFQSASGIGDCTRLSLPASYDEASQFLEDAAAEMQSRIELLRNSA